MAGAVNARAPITGGSLRLFGDWFGRPGDNVHTVVRATTSEVGDPIEDRLVLHFDEGETLSVIEPEDLVLGEHSLSIRGASRVTWRWFSYGLPHLSEHLYTIDYRRRGNVIDVIDTSDWYEPQHTVDITAKAVEL